MSVKRPRTEILIAIIGLIGVLGAAVIANWDKIVRTKPDNINSVTNANQQRANTASPSLPSPVPGECEILRDVPHERIRSVEEGGEIIVLGPSQSKGPPFALRLEKEGKPVGAIKMHFFEQSGELFKVATVVDAQCQPIETFESDKGSDKHTLPNYRDLTIHFKDGTFLLYMSYDVGKIRAKFTETAQ